MSKPKILIVDDQEVFREALVRSFREAGFCEQFDLVEAANGAEAVERVEQHEDIRFAVVDIHMPVMNGVEFIKRFRADFSDRYENCRVFVITTEASRALRTQMRELGVIAWLVKPVKPKMFIHTLRSRFADELTGISAPGAAAS